MKKSKEQTKGRLTAKSPQAEIERLRKERDALKKQLEQKREKDALRQEISELEEENERLRRELEGALPPFQPKRNWPWDERKPWRWNDGPKFIMISAPMMNGKSQLDISKLLREKQ